MAKKKGGMSAGSLLGGISGRVDGHGAHRESWIVDSHVEIFGLPEINSLFPVSAG